MTKEIVNKFKSFLLASIVLVIASVVLFGWFTHDDFLIQIQPSFVPMQFNTAVCFILLSIAIMTLNKHKNISLILSSLVILLTVLTLSEYIFNVDLGIDQMFRHYDLDSYTTFPGRMAINTSIGLLIAALNILVNVFKKNFLTQENKFVAISKRIFLRVSGSLIMVLGLLSLIGYITGIQTAHGWGRYTHISLLGSIAFMILGISLFFYNLDVNNLKKENQNSIILITILFGASFSFSIAKALHIQQMEYGVDSTLPRTVLFFGIIVSVLLGYLIYLNHRGQLHKQLLEDSNKQFIESNSRLEEFAYVASHDLQEPLRMISQNIKRLRDRFTELNKDEEVTKYMDFISDGTARMHNLVTDLLDYSKLGNPETSFQPVNLNKVIEIVLLDLNEDINKSGAKIKIENLPTISGIEIQLMRLFKNLISNSIKYRQKEKILEVDVKVNKLDAGWLLTFADNGIGFKQEYNDRIFKLFQKLHSHYEYPGTGMGLAICKNITEYHGGKIWAESTPNQGSSFFVFLPD